jgi:hypothetical protein
VSALPRFLAKLIGLLEGAGIPYMVTGSLGSGFHGEPRASRDVDVVIDATREQVERFVAASAADWYVSLDEARDAVSRRSMFNVVDLETGWKADLILVKDRAYSRTEFARRRTAALHGRAVDVVSAEDAVLSKLEWARESRSELPLRDVAGILRARGEALDREYLRRWAAELGVRDLLDDCERRANDDAP